VASFGVDPVFKPGSSVYNPDMDDPEGVTLKVHLRHTHFIFFWPCLCCAFVSAVAVQLLGVCNALAGH
jgi:hypothetical protein